MPEEAGKEKQKKANRTIFKKFEKEILKLPNVLQLKIKKAIEKTPRFHKGIYEKRARINGIDIYGAGSDIGRCESQFWNDLVKKLDLVGDETSEETIAEKRLKRNMTFGELAEIWLNDVFRPSVVPDSFLREVARCRKHIFPVFEKKHLSDIKPLDCIRFFNELKERDLERTAESLYNTMNRIFQFAVESEILAKNPMRAMKPVKHEREHGTPLTKEEELRLLAGIKGGKYEATIVLALYTGLRPCEYETARIEGNFVVAQNRKQKNPKKVAFKRIPITPMLAPYIGLIREKMPQWKACCNELNVYKFFKNIMPNHRLYDLRTTFSTRCQECGVAEQVVQLFMGHSAKTLLGKVYTQFDDAFLIKEAEKVKY